jgi:hypothetical protein
MEMLKIILEKANSKNDEQRMVEEYSNDNNVNIYSHDNLNTNTNDHDTLMVDSILNMVKEDLDNNNIEVDINVDETSSTEQTEANDDIEHTDAEQPEFEQQKVEQSDAEQPEVEQPEVEQPKAEQQLVKQPEEQPQLVEHLEASDNDSDMVLIKENTSNKISLESLNKKKLDELHELSLKYNIDINNENGKKKKKSDLAQEIFNKQ